MTTYEIITIASQCISILFLSLTVLYAARQLKLVISINSQTHEWNRRNAAQEMCVRYAEFNPNKTLLFHELEIYKNQGDITLECMEDKFSNNSELRNAAHMMLNYFEYLCIGIKQGIYDEVIIQEFWSNVMSRFYSMMRPYIIDQRKRAPGLWVYIEEYNSKWEYDRRQSETRPKIA